MKYDKPKKLTLTVITLSDRASRGEYEDLSGPEIEKLASKHLQTQGWDFSTKRILIPDDVMALKKNILQSIDNKVDIIITTGGTGIGPNDITPDAVRPLIEKEIPGIMEYIRVKYGEKLPNALLSRGIAGVSQKSLIYTLPGSVKAVRDYMAEILKTVEHLIFMLHGIDVHKKHN